MKKIFLLLAFCVFSTAFSQIKVLKNESLSEIGSDNSVGLFKKANRYTFHYQDRNTANLNTYRSFTFLDLNRDVEGLYKLISDGFIDVSGSNISLELPNDIIELHFEKNYGQPTVQFIQYMNKNKKYVGKSPFLTKKQIDKIFGKSTGKSIAYEKSPIVNQADANAQKTALVNEAKAEAEKEEKATSVINKKKSPTKRR